MRKIVVAGLIILGLGALAVIVPASASQNTPNGTGRALRHGSSSRSLAPLAAGDAFVSNDDFFTQTFNHFGDPARGSVVGESWIETGFDNANTPQDIQGFTRTILLPHALRTSLKVQLYGFVTLDVNPDLITSSSTVNSAGALTRQVATPEIPASQLANDPHCFFFALATISIRWDDGRLSSNLILDPPVVVSNPSNPACA